MLLKIVVGLAARVLTGGLLSKNNVLPDPQCWFTALIVGLQTSDKLSETKQTRIMPNNFISRQLHILKTFFPLHP